MDDALLSISLAGHGQLVKMLITLVHVPHSIFGSKFAYLFILIFLDTGMHSLDEHDFGRSRSCRMVYLDNVLHNYTVKHCLSIGIQSNYESSLSISRVQSWSMNENAHNS